MKTEGVDTTHITFTDEALTGVGQLTVLPNGKNRVITVSGANAHLTVNDIISARTMISAAKVMLCENQIEKEPALAALQMANDLGGIIRKFVDKKIIQLLNACYYIFSSNNIECCACQC